MLRLNKMCKCNNQKNNVCISRGIKYYDIKEDKKEINKNGIKHERRYN